MTLAVGATDAACTGIAIDDDGRIVLAGTADNGADSDFAVVRVLGDGGLDASFGSDGVATADFGGSEGVYAMALQSDGKIVVVGETKIGPDIDFAVARFLAE